ncbi:hypothetical protein QTP88_020763 [Uroleucon formosanum]
MLWITLTPKTIVTWENVKKSVQFINNVMSKPNSVTFDEETFFEQFKTFEKIFHQQNDEWHHQDIEDKWLFIFKTFADNNQEFSMLLKVVEFSFVLPGSNAAVERVFSLMNNTWTNSRNKLDIKTVEASLIIKTSFNNTSCEEFYKQILENKSLLRQVHGSAKYLALAKSTEETLESENSEDGSMPTATDNIQPEAFNNVIDEPINDVLLEKKASRKRTLNQNNWKRKKATIERKSGKQYTTQKGVIVPAKCVNEGQLCMSKCRLKCTTTVNLERRKFLFESYCKMDTNVKNAYLFKSLKKFETVRVSKNATRVRSCSSNILLKVRYQKYKYVNQHSVRFFKLARHTEGASPHEDLQGKHSNRPHKVQDHVIIFIVDHINSFPADSSHYSRNNNSNRKYLSPTLNIHQLFLLYIEKYDEKNKPQCYKVKEGTYRNIFCTKFNLGFGSPQSDTCSKCDSGESENAEHINLYKTAFEVQKRDRAYALENPSTCFMTMDLQQTMPLSKLSTSKAFYLRQIWFYNFGIHTITSENGHKPFMFNWTKEVTGKGSNEVGSCLMYFTQLSQLTFQQNIKHLIIWSDSCSGQNKKFNIICERSATVTGDAGQVGVTGHCEYFGTTARHAAAAVGRAGLGTRRSVTTLGHTVPRPLQ